MPLKILLVEDSAGDARLIREMLHDEPSDSFELTHLLTMADAVRHLSEAAVDIALLDMGLPDAHGLDSVRRARAAAPDVPVIVLTGLDDEALAAEAMKAGAQDYLIKNQIEARALPRALRYAIERHSMQIEADRIREQQIQFKDEFLSHVSHELRSPLGAIYQFVTILRDGLVGDMSPQQECLDILLANVMQLRSMINDLLEVTHVHAGKLIIEPQRMSVTDTIGYTVGTLEATAAARNIKLTVHAADTLPLVWADPMRVRQILLILADNALKFTPTHGAVTVTAHGSKEESSFVIVEVADSGPGIALEVIDQVFERLFQASGADAAGRRGLGLGLYICRQLVTRQGGKVWVTSTPGEGAKFCITLPVFSLSGLIAPTLERIRGRPLALIVMAMASKIGWQSDESHVEASRALRDVLLACLEPELEILLPNMGAAGATELYFIVSGVPEMGVETHAKRMRDRISRSASVRLRDLQIGVSSRMVQISDASKKDATESPVDRLVAEIQQRVDEEFSSRLVQHG